MKSNRTYLFFVALILFIVSVCWYNSANAVRWGNIFQNTKLEGVTEVSNGINHKPEAYTPVTSAVTIRKTKGDFYIFNTTSTTSSTYGTTANGIAGVSTFIEAMTSDCNGWTFTVKKQDVISGTTPICLIPAAGDSIETYNGSVSGTTKYPYNAYDINAQGEAQTYMVVFLPTSLGGSGTGASIFRVP